MKSIVISSLFFFLMLIPGYAQDTIRGFFDKEWKEVPDANKATYYRKAFLDNNKVWVANDYYISGKIQMTGTFKSKRLDIKQGHFVYYYENGQKKSEGKYLNNKAEDEWNLWYENGQIKSRGKFIDDRFVGEWNYWFENGYKKSHGMMVNDQRDGEWDFWNDRGILETKEYYKNGILTHAEAYFDNGIRSSSGKYLNGKRSGLWTCWNTEGKIAFQGNFKNGLREGEWTRSFPEGKMTVYYEKGEIQDKKFGGIVRRE
jgi:uncharacterized protein